MGSLTFFQEAGLTFARTVLEDYQFSRSRIQIVHVPALSKKFVIKTMDLKMPVNQLEDLIIHWNALREEGLNIVYIYYAEENNGIVTSIHEYHQTTLYDFLNQNLETQELLKNIIIRVLIGLMGFRKAQIVHFDLHSKNIFMNMTTAQQLTYQMQKKYSLPNENIDVLIGDYGESNFKENIGIIKFFQYYFPEYYFAHPEIIESQPQENIFFVDIWRFFKNIDQMMATKPYKKIFRVIHYYLPDIEKKILRMFNPGLSENEYIDYIDVIIDHLNLEFSA